MQARINKRYKTLNGTQVSIIHSAIEFPLNDILITLINDPHLAIQAINCINDIAEYVKHKEAFKNLNVLDSIDQIRDIVKHDFPQNCNQTYAYLDDDAGICKFRIDRVNNRLRKRDDNGGIELKNGRIFKRHQILVDDREKDYIIVYEPTGLLNLTTREDDVTPPASKNDVLLCITDILEEQKTFLKSLSGKLIELIAANTTSIQELMQGCDDLTIALILKIDVLGLTILLKNPQAIIRLRNKLHISTQDFIDLNELEREFLIKQIEDIIKVCEIPGSSWRDLLNLPPDFLMTYKSFSTLMMELIKAKKTTFEDLKRLNRNDFITKIANLLETSEFPQEIWLKTPVDVLDELLKGGLNPNLVIKGKQLLSLFLEINSNDTRQKARLLIRHGAISNSERNNNSIKNLQMLRIYNDAFAQAQKNMTSSNDIDFGFMRRFLELYINKRSQKYAFGTTSLFLQLHNSCEKLFYSSFRNISEMLQNSLGDNKFGKIELEEYLRIIKKILEATIENNQLKRFISSDTPLGSKVLYALVNYMIDRLDKQALYIDLVVASPGYMEEELLGAQLDYVKSVLNDILMQISPYKEYTCEKVYNEYFRDSSNISFESFFLGHREETEVRIQGVSRI